MNTTVHEFPTTDLSTAARCVVLGLEGCALLLAQTEVLALESALDVKPSPLQRCNVTGVLPLAAEECAVYSLDCELHPLPTLPPQHRICVVLAHPRGPFAMSCAEVRMVERSALTLHPLPHAFAARSGPLRMLAVTAGRLLLGSTAAALLSYLAQPQADIIPFAPRARQVRT